MASADLSKDLECSICLNSSKDPVTLKCGHNFCRDCIGCVLDTQEGSGGYSCPECREEFQERPELLRNITLRNIVENFLSAQPDREYSEVISTYCIQTPVPAVIAGPSQGEPLQHEHLRVHKKLPEHVLCDPTTSLENRKCSVHKKILEYYCIEDSTCICVSCRLDGEHRGHQVKTLDEASEMKKNKLRNVLLKLMMEKEGAEKRVQSLQEHGRKVQGKTDDETQIITTLFRDLRRHLEDLEKRVLSELSGQAQCISLSLSYMIQQLEIKKEELSRKMGDIEELCNTTDPLTVLQESDTGDLCDTEDGDEDRERPGLLLDGMNLDVAGISHTLHTGLSDIMSWINAQKSTGSYVYRRSTTKSKGHINVGPSRRRPKPYPTIQHLLHQAGGPNIGAVQPTLGVLGVTDLLLDVNTAGDYLHISDNRKIASWLTHQRHPETPERFHWPQAISIQSFSSGRYYWEVDAGDSLYWRVGMCYPSIDRKGDQSQIGCNKKSWSLRRFADQYSVIHNRKVLSLPVSVSSTRVRIDLDYEAGRISFYELCETIRFLHTYTTTFTEPLHAGLRVGLSACLKISGGNQMMAPGPSFSF